MLSRKNSVLVAALTILAVLVGTAGVSRAALVANWKLQDTSGSTVVNSVGGYTGTLNTNTSYLPTLGQTSPTPVIGTYSCLFNGGTSSDGSNQSNGRLSNITTTLNQNGWAAATWSAWIYLPTSMQPSGSVQQGIFEDNSSSDKMYLRLAASGSYSYTSANNNTDCNSGLSSPPSYNAWHLVTLTYDSGSQLEQVQHLPGWSPEGAEQPKRDPHHDLLCHGREQREYRLFPPG